MADDANGESFEQKPHLRDLFGRSDDELNGLIDKVAGMATDQAFSAIVNSNDTQEVAGAMLSSAGLLGALGYTTREVEQLALFEKLDLPETPETTDIYACYRLARLRIILRAGAHFSDPMIQDIIDEQEASVYQDDKSSMGIYHRLAQEGDVVSFSKWFHLHCEAMHNSDEQVSEFDPFPPFSEFHEFAVIIQDQITKAGLAFETSKTELEESVEPLLSYLEVIKNEFESSPRKALFAERLSHVVYSVTRLKIRDVTAPAEKLYFEMLKKGIEDPNDKIGERITDSRLHKRLIMSLIGLQQLQWYKENVTCLLEKWEAAGMFDERDMRKIGIWQLNAVKSSQTHKSRKRR